jgi:hypothetical protein
MLSTRDIRYMNLYGILESIRIGINHQFSLFNPFSNRFYRSEGVLNYPNYRSERTKYHVYINV